MSETTGGDSSTTREGTFSRSDTEREKSEEKSNYNSLCIVGVIIGARASIMEVQRRLRIGRRSLDGVREDEAKQGRTGRVRWSEKKNEEKDEGGRRGWREERERERALGIVSMTYVALTLSAKRL